MKQQEIERKFLVKDDGWRGRSEGVLFRQGYIARTQDRTVRVRVAGEEGTLTIKYRGEGIARSEFEYGIPLDEAQALLDGLDPGEVIEKKRFTFEENGDVWEVDEFMGANEGLIVAEIELESEEQDFVRPDWLGAEVSKISRYLNVELSKLPYRAWDSSLRAEN
jgi:CYTH domain-containing protein